MKAKVIEIQVCGAITFRKWLSDACLEYIKCVTLGIDREKIAFVIRLPDGSIKSITIRQEDDDIVAYGDFEGLPTMLDYVKTEKEKNEESHTS